MCSAFSDPLTCEAQSGCGWATTGNDPDTDRSMCLATQDQTPGDDGVGWSDDSPDGSLFDDTNNFGNPKCCGDDSNEYYFTQGEDACCDEITDCVNYIGKCFDSDTGSTGWHCYNHKWSKCTEDSDVGKVSGSYICANDGGIKWTEITNLEDPDIDRNTCLSAQDKTPGDSGIGWSDDSYYDFDYKGNKYNIDFLWWGPPYESMEKCERYSNGLKQNNVGGAYVISKYYDHDHKSGEPSPLTRQQRINEFRDFYNSCIKDSNLFTFIGFDEPSGWNYKWGRNVFPTQESLTELRNGYTLIKEVCPSCPVYGNYLVRILNYETRYPEMVSKHLDAADIVSIDIYPFHVGAKSFFGNVDINSVAYTTERMKEMLEGKNKPFFVILEGMNVTWTGDWKSYPDYIEMKNMAYQSLMHGADGIMYFSFIKSPVSQNVKRITNEIKLLEKIFLAKTINKNIPKYSDYWPTKGYPRPALVTKNPNVPNPEYLVKKYNDDYYFIVLNNKNQQIQINYVIKNLIKRTETTWKVQEIVEGIPSGAPKQLQNIEITLQRYEVKVYKIYRSSSTELTEDTTAELCQGIATTCEFFNSESLCESQQSCSWQSSPGSCTGKAQPCNWWKRYQCCGSDDCKKYCTCFM